MRADSRAVRVALIALASYVLVVVAFHFAGPWYARAFSPLTQVVISATLPGIDVRAVAVESRVLRFDLVTRGDKRGPRFDASLRLPIGTTYVVPIVALTLVFAWPLTSRRAKAMALTAVLPVAAAVEALNLRVVLLAGIGERLAKEGHAPNALESWWWFIADNGGRQLLGALVAALVLHTSIRLERRWAAPLTEAPPNDAKKPRNKSKRRRLQRA